MPQNQDVNHSQLQTISSICLGTSLTSARLSGYLRRHLYLIDSEHVLQALLGSRYNLDFTL